MKIIKRKNCPVALQPRNNHILYPEKSKFLSTIKKKGGNIISPFLRRLEKPHQDGIERNLLFLTCLFFMTAKIRLLMVLGDYTDSSDSAKPHPCLEPCEPHLLYWQVGSLPLSCQGSPSRYRSLFSNLRT